MSLLSVCYANISSLFYPAGNPPRLWRCARTEKRSVLFIPTTPCSGTTRCLHWSPSISLQRSVPRPVSSHHRLPCSMLPWCCRSSLWPTGNRCWISFLYSCITSRRAVFGSHCLNLHCQFTRTPLRAIGSSFSSTWWRRRRLFVPHRCIATEHRFIS